MSKERKQALLIAVTFLLTFLCLGLTFGLQIHMQDTLESLAEIPYQTTVADTTAAAAFQPKSDGTSESSEVLQSLEVSAVAAVQTGGNGGNTVEAAKAPATEAHPTTAPRPTEIADVLIINKNSKKIHSPTCSYVKNMKAENRGEISADELDAYLAQGYTMCQRCKGYAS